MVRTTVAIRRIAMARENDFRLQFRDAGRGLLEVIDFKPQEHAIARREFGVADGTMMMLHVPAVQLKHQPALRNESLIMVAAVIAPAAKEPLIPAAARFHITNANQGLRAHKKFARYFNVCTSTDSTPGRCDAISVHESPPSGEQ